MILISHRGNIDGLKPEKENSCAYIDKALELGYDVEIDLWYKNDSLWLGHDKADYPVELSWLLERKKNLWIHCKNFEALSYLSEYKEKMNFFFHSKEEYVIISNGLIWAHNINKVDNNCVIPLLNKNDIKEWKFKPVYGICSDYVKLL